MRRLYGLAVLLLLALTLLAPRANGQFGHVLLDDVASAFASRPITVTCASVEEDGVFEYAWGYVQGPLDVQTVAHIEDIACFGALAIAQDSDFSSDFMKAVGASVLVHESFHLKRIRGNRDEARTECRAMRHYDVALRKLGASQAVMDRLMPIMLILHWQLRAITEDWSHQPATIFGPNKSYHRPGCMMPRRYDRYLGWPPR